MQIPHFMLHALFQLIQRRVVFCLLRGFQRFAPFHLLHQEIDGHRGVALLLRVHAVQRQQIARATQGIAQGLVSLVDARRPLHGETALRLGKMGEFVGMDLRLQRKETPLQRGAVDFEYCRKVEELEEVLLEIQVEDIHQTLKLSPQPHSILHVRIVELESFVQALAGVIQFHAVDVGQAVLIDQHRHAVADELQVFAIHRVGELQLVCHAGTTAGAHAETQADALAALGQEILHMFRRIFSQRDRHFSFPFIYCRYRPRSPPLRHAWPCSPPRPP